jgi:hypothetical protein
MLYARRGLILRSDPFITMSNDRSLESPTRKEVAEFFRLGLRLGLFDTSPIIKWADSIIEQEDKPDISIIDVSLAGSRGINETITCLGEIKGHLREDVPVELLLAYFRRKLVSGQLNIDSVAAMFYSLAKMPEVTGDVAGALHVLDENLSMAEDGLCGSVEEALDDIKCFLEEHGEYEQYLPQEV